MKIGLLLGSFDPIHIAHINIAACVINSGLCDKVLFVVAQHNPWKQNKPMPFELRCEMISASLNAFNGQCEVCDLERDIEPPTYSYKVLDKLREKYPNDELLLICGSDTIESVSSWKNFESDIKDKVGFIEIKRNDGTEIGDDKTPFIIYKVARESLTNKGFWCIKTQKMDVSSTMIREMIANGFNPYPYITKETLDIIRKYNLYSNGKPIV
jgi:nicotinate-nucleotide adenylyltransferase